MAKKLSCFVIIGYGKKTSYAGGEIRELDLNETYELLIKPVFDELDINCYRAIDINVSGSIDQVMLEQIKNAEIALADLSTLNANVMWELGVRHALKPRHTVMICEKLQMGALPFDINHFVVHQYVHSKEGLPFKEVTRFKAYLKGVIEKIVQQTSVMSDSPVYTFLKTENIERLSKMGSDHTVEVEKNEDSFSSLIEEAESEKENRRYKEALQLLARAREIAQKSMALRHIIPFIICRQVLCTYKSKDPDEKTALIKAREILEILKPSTSFDTEVLALTGAIKKRLFEVTKEVEYLQSSVKYYEKGYTLKQDYYNGVNTAFGYYELAAIETENKEHYRFRADNIRDNVLEIALKLEKGPVFMDSDDAVWILLTIAEAYHMKGNAEKMVEYEEKARLTPDEKKRAFAFDSYENQKNKLVLLYND